MGVVSDHLLVDFVRYFERCSNMGTDPGHVASLLCLSANCSHIVTDFL